MPILFTVSHPAFLLRKHTLTDVIAVDQPVGTGFSYGSTDKYIKELKDVRFHSCLPGQLILTHIQLPTQVLEFMRNFYKVFPELAGTDVGSSSLAC